ncbi:hypothetical protein BKA61DRAFT_229656 [Leptodontidium sp. MPI-SDFR-AT-0119]|nr:hypothetical protein BKA61DRAFT_229656 [Leptodontidium sp. MPI-SDFR-AT-0119]
MGGFTTICLLVCSCGMGWDVYAERCRPAWCSFVRSFAGPAQHSTLRVLAQRSAVQFSSARMMCVQRPMSSLLVGTWNFGCSWVVVDVRWMWMWWMWVVRDQRAGKGRAGRERWMWCCACRRRTHNNKKLKSKVEDIAGRRKGWEEEEEEEEREDKREEWKSHVEAGGRDGWMDGWMDG